MRHAWVLPLLLATLLPASSGAIAGPLLVPQMLAETGLDQILTQLGDGVSHSAADSGVTDKDLLAKWQAMAGTMFKIERINTELGTAFAAHPLSDDDQAAMATFYDSDLGRRLIAAEVATDKLDADQSEAALDEGRKITATLSPRRVRQYARFWEVANEPSVAIGNGLLRAGILAVYLAHNHSADAAVPWSNIDRVLDTVSARAMPDLKDNMTFGNAYVYKDFSDDELDAYLDFLASPAGQHFYAVSGDALDQVISDEVTRFGAAIAGAVNAVAI